MQQKRWFCSLLDMFGILSLTCAIIALGGAMWFVDVIPESLLFKIFYGCLAAAVVGFVVSRLAQLFNVIAQNPDPKRLRTQPMAESAVAAPAADGADVTDGKFPRAA